MKFNSINNSSSLKSIFRKIIKTILIVVPLGLLGNIIYLLITVDSGITKSLTKINIYYLLIAILMSFVPWFAQSLRVLIWSKVFKKNLKPINAFRIVLASDVGAAATPTMLGGGYAKFGLLIAYGFNAAEATLVTILGSLVDAVFFGIALPIAVYWCRAWENPYVINAWDNLLSNWPTVVAVLAVLLIALIILRRLKAQKQEVEGKQKLIGRIFSAISKYKNELITAGKFVASNGKTAFLACVIVGGIGWISRYGAITVLVLGLGYSADPILFFLLQWVVFTTMTMIPTPGAMGGAEVSFAVIYNGLIPASILPIAMSAWRFITFYLLIGFGSILFSIMGFGISLDSDKSKIEI